MISDYVDVEMNDSPEYIRRTCLLQSAATMFSSGQIHCGEQCRELDAIFQEIERETGWNANRPVVTLAKLWSFYNEKSPRPSAPREGTAHLNGTG